MTPPPIVHNDRPVAPPTVAQRERAVRERRTKEDTEETTRSFRANEHTIRHMTDLEKEVLGLEVAVRHLHPVEVLGAVEDLVEEVARLVLLHALVRHDVVEHLATVPHKFHKVPRANISEIEMKTRGRVCVDDERSTFPRVVSPASDGRGGLRAGARHANPPVGVLHDQVDGRRRVKHFKQLDDVPVPVALQDFDLTRDPLDVGNLDDAALLQNLHRDLLAGQDVRPDFHLAKGALTNRLAENIMSDHGCARARAPIRRGRRAKPRRAGWVGAGVSGAGARPRAHCGDSVLLA